MPLPQSADNARNRKNRSDIQKIRGDFCFLGLRAFSTLWQSVDFVNILGERACTAPPFAIFRGCAARAEKALAFFRALWYTIPCSTGDDDRVPCGVMLRIVSGPEGSSTKQKLARAAGYAWSESVGFSFGRKMPPLPKHGGGAFFSTST